MERITATLDEDLVAEIDRFQRERGYQGRSEALRDLVRTGLRETVQENEAGACVAALVYVYDHEVRALAKRLTTAQHDHHDISVATVHVHLDHQTCLEVAILRGSSAEVRHFSEHVIAERGVRHGRLVVVPVAIEAEAHSHGSGKAHMHAHARVRHAGGPAKSGR
jgi:CopG family nickel-responsive transcriptional regulator